MRQSTISCPVFFTFVIDDKGDLPISLPCSVPWYWVIIRATDNIYSGRGRSGTVLFLRYGRVALNHSGDTKYYDKRQSRLIYADKRSSDTYWDARWGAMGSLRGILESNHSFVVRVTRQYLEPADGPILEGGSGRGINVASLVNNGYEVIGVDYARATVEALKESVPELDIRFGDVRDLPFESETFAGYWSLGVIEHFWEGYNEIASEAARVLRREGYLFLTFPHMSPLRDAKARLGLYPEYQGEEVSQFFQFALRAEEVVRKFESVGFRLVSKRRIGGIKGFKDEVRLVKAMLQKLFDYNGQNRAVFGTRLLLEKLFSPFTGHSMLLVLRKESNSTA
jgi:SAM-dependent methyltransferase